MAGPHIFQEGGGSNFLCLPYNPQYGEHITDAPGLGFAYIYGAEYQHLYQFSYINNGGRSIFKNDAPCAACYIHSRHTSIMIPTRRECPAGWTQEYQGYLVAESANSGQGRKRSSYTCLDGAPEAVPGGQATSNQASLYAVRSGCGALHCPNYIEGWELTCTVCTR